ncbi:MAG TPA: ABC transporter ATP-binding protein [Phycisphaerae bacterium]|nr:ABC transporter ATP-binding protein [Phycisphaerae bacterium]
MAVYLRAMGYFRRDGGLIGLLLGVIGLQTGVGLLAAWPMAVLVDSVLTTAPKTSGVHGWFLAVLPGSRLGQVVGLAAVGLLLKLTGDVLNVVRTIVTARINYNGLMRVRCDLYRKLQALTLSYHRSQPQGDAIYRLSNDTFGCQAILHTFISTGVAVATLAVMTVILAARNGTLTALALGVAPFLAGANIYYGRRLKAESLACKDRDTEFTTTVQRSMSLIALVQAFGREGDEFARFHGSIRNCVRAWFKLHHEEVSYWMVVGTILGVGGALVFGYGGYLVMRDMFPRPRAGGMTVGDLLIFTSYLGMLWDPLCKLTGAGATMQGGAAGAERVFEVLDRDVAIRDEAGARELERRSRVLELEGVTFSYGKEPVLREVSARIEPGQMVAFVGSSGVGKSTLLNLLPRFYDPCAGVLRLDGVDAREVRIADLRRHIALVLQESVILPTTIAENIAYGRPEATVEEIRRAAEMAGAAEFIEVLSERYETRVAEGGGNLSGGQRQRISIARALLTEAPVIVLDEPTSALDPHHERVVIEQLGKIKGQRTVVIVSHRLSTVAGCDQIFMMEGGRIVERGTHVELMGRRGKYWEMARQQLPEEGGEDVAAAVDALAAEAREVARMSMGGVEGGGVEAARVG